LHRHRGPRIRCQSPARLAVANQSNCLHPTAQKPQSAVRIRHRPLQNAQHRRAHVQSIERLAATQPTHIPMSRNFPRCRTYRSDSYMVVMSLRPRVRYGPSALETIIRMDQGCSCTSNQVGLLRWADQLQLKKPSVTELERHSNVSAASDRIRRRAWGICCCCGVPPNHY